MAIESFPHSGAASQIHGGVRRIAVGMNGFAEGEDALALGAALANAAGAELMLVAVHPQALIVLPHGMDWSSLREAARATLRDASNRVAPDARMVVESDLSVPRALQRVVRRDHRDLLVVGSSRRAPEGGIQIGKRTRQLLGHFDSALAVAPRGLHRAGQPALTRIGVGYDSSPEAQAALELAAALAANGGASLYVRGVVDDRPPPVGWSSLGRAYGEYWAAMVEPMMEALRQDADAATQALEISAEIDVQRGRPAARLLALSRQVDLLVVGSRRWGPVARLLLGSTGEALMHGAACPVIAVPRPAA